MKGKTSTVIIGEIERQFCEYTFFGRKGQVLQVSFRPYDRPRAFLFLPIEKSLANDEPYILPKNGKYTLRVALSSQDMKKFHSPQRFTLQFSLTTRVRNDDSPVGQFGAIVSCDYCTGIETRLHLFDNQTYTLREKYLGVGANSSFSQKGKWQVENKIVRLMPDDPNKDDRFLFYKRGAMYWIAPFEAKSANPTLRADYRLPRQ